MAEKSCDSVLGGTATELNKEDLRDLHRTLPCLIQINPARLLEMCAGKTLKKIR